MIRPQEVRNPRCGQPMIKVRHIGRVRGQGGRCYRTGLGRLALDATLTRDYPVILGTVLVASLGTIVVNLIADLLYAAVDPRITYA